MTTTNMSLTLPDVQITASPTWATQLNAALEMIDEHDHTTGRGVRITPAAININANLDMNSYSFTEVNAVYLDDRSADVTTRGVYAKNGELYYFDTAGNAVQLTNGGSVAGVSGSFTGLSSPASATYSSVNKQFTWYYDASSHARQATGDVQLYPYDGTTAYTKAVTLKAPTGLEATASYSLTFPTAVPASGVGWLNVNSSGQLAHATLAGTSNQVNVSQSTSAITLSLPQNIHTGASPQFTGLTLTGVLVASAGTVSAPSLSFTGDANTGVYSSAADTIDFTTGGTNRVSISSTAVTPSVAILSSATNSVSAPVYSFSGDTNTGMYRIGADNLGLTAGGTKIVDVSTSGVAITGTATISSTLGVTGTLTGAAISGTTVSASTAFRAADGSVGAPGISFTSDTDTGIYRIGSNVLGFATAGTKRGEFNGSGQLQVSLTGSAATPSFYVGADATTGLYSSTGALNVTRDGVFHTQFNSNGIYVEGGVQTGASKGYLQWETFEGTIAGATTSVITVSGATRILGVCGRSSVNGVTTAWQPMPVGDNGEDIIYLNIGANSAANTVRLTNGDSDSTNTYDMVVFYY